MLRAHSNDMLYFLQILLPSSDKFIFGGWQKLQSKFWIENMKIFFLCEELSWTMKLQMCEDYAPSHKVWWVETASYQSCTLSALMNSWGSPPTPAYSGFILYICWIEDWNCQCNVNAGHNCKTNKKNQFHSCKWKHNGVNVLLLECTLLFLWHRHQFLQGQWQKGWEITAAFGMEGECAL